MTLIRVTGVRCSGLVPIGGLGQIGSSFPSVTWPQVCRGNASGPGCIGKTFAIPHLYSREVDTQLCIGFTNGEGLFWFETLLTLQMFHIINSFLES